MCTHSWHCSTCIKLNRKTAFEKNCKDFNSICTEVLLNGSLVYCPCSITVYWEWISCAMEEERMKSITSLLWCVRSTSAFCHFALNWLFIFSASLFVISSLINFTIWGESVCVCFETSPSGESEWYSMINHFLLTLVGVCTAACFHVHLCASKCVCDLYLQ